MPREPVAYLFSKQEDPMGTEIPVHLDQHLEDRLEAALLLHGEAFPGRAITREELLQRALDEGLQRVLGELLVQSRRRTPSPFVSGKYRRMDWTAVGIG